MQTLKSDEPDGRVLLLAPTGRDASMTAKILDEAGMMTESCAGIEDFCAKLTVGATAAFITEEALTPMALERLVEVLNRQPQWSDFPFVVLTSGGESVPANINALRLLGEAGNVTLIERPTRVITLVSALRAARRARRRQYEVRDHLLEQKRAAEERARLLERAEAANTAKDEFLATMSHELRTPLTSILGWAHLLRTKSLGEDNETRALETIERNARAQAKLIDDLLDISRIMAGKLRLDVQPVNLAMVIASAIDATRPAAEEKAIDLQVQIDSRACPISGDTDRLQQVIWNLLSNAIKFTPNDGRVLVKLERLNSHAEISISDSGKGINAEFLPHVFDRFRQADGTTTRAHGGLGLGLAIVRQLVELHGGTVSAKSDGEAQGANFIVQLPLMAERKKENRPKHMNLAAEGGISLDCPPSLEGLRVLVVDDEPDTRDILRAVLEQCGSHVVTVASVAEALEKLDQVKPDVLISDIAMPEEDGYSLIGKVRALEAVSGEQIPAIALTAYAQAEDRIRALAAGFHVHVPKPVEPTELLTKVANLTGRTGKA